MTNRIGVGENTMRSTSTRRGRSKGSEKGRQRRLGKRGMLGYESQDQIVKKARIGQRG